MRGHIRERSSGHWAIVVDLNDSAGSRLAQMAHFQRTKRKVKWRESRGGQIERVPMRPEELEAAMAANKQLETKLTASLSDVEILKAQLTAMLEAR